MRVLQSFDVDDPRFQQDDDWFREPSRRERWIAAALFVGFGIFFAMLFVVQRGWWFRWVILALGAISVINGVRHAIAART